MDTANILKFLSELTANNNREWFTANKDRYEQCRSEFEEICTEFIHRIAEFDPEVKNLQAKDCIFRIYRDIRFSPNKTPYKDHFGAFVAKNGGRKSDKSGYYLHLQPGSSIIACGMWCPPPNLLTAVRQSVYDNIEEFLEILNEPTFKQTYPTLWDFEKLKTVPRGFPKDWEYGDLLKMKHYMVEHSFSDEFVQSNAFLNEVIKCAQTAVSFNNFLNYTADEVL